MFNRLLPLLLVVILLAGTTGCSPGPRSSLRVAVMLPLSGTDYFDYRLPLEWARENLNAAGVAGRELELVYFDLAKEDLASSVRKIIQDDSILAVIGPDTSSRVYAVASELLAANKVMVSPCATSGDLFRAFSQYKTFWRTVESDISQMRTMLTIASRDGARKVALVTSSEQYGATFFDWFGFFATELGLQITDILRYDAPGDSGKEAVKTALSHQPDVLLAIPVDSETAVTMAEAWKDSGSRVKLMFSDTGNTEYLIQSLGTSADGIEGTQLSPDAENGFAQSFRERFNRDPTPYAANVYDAVCLLAYGLAYSGAQGGLKLADSLTQVVDARGAHTGWDKPGIASALQLISTGNLPNISGAAGPLDFDRDSHTEITSSTYLHWRVEEGTFREIEYFDTGHSATAINQLSAFREQASLNHIQDAGGQAYQPGERTGLWALIVAASKGWDNYRHQADALAQYQMLRRNGVPDDHIVLILDEDVASSPHNPERGTIRNVSGGSNLDAGVKIDYRIDQLNSNDLLSILSGKSSSELPEVIHSGPGDNIYVFMAGHGDEKGLYPGLDNAALLNRTQYSVLTPDALAQTISKMYDQNLYRRLLIAIEACHGGAMGSRIQSPGVLLISGANQYENSLSINYDTAGKVWLADAFAYRLVTAETERPAASVEDIYEDCYLQVSGSHVCVFAPAFGDADDVSLREFIAP